MEGKEEKIEERERKGENFQHRSVKVPFQGNQVNVQLKKKFQISPVGCVVKPNQSHAGYFQEVHHK